MFVVVVCYYRVRSGQVYVGETVSCIVAIDAARVRLPYGVLVQQIVWPSIRTACRGGFQSVTIKYLLVNLASLRQPTYVNVHNVIDAIDPMS